MSAEETRSAPNARHIERRTARMFTEGSNPQDFAKGVKTQQNDLAAETNRVRC